MEDRRKFFDLALDRAFAQIGITSPNPAVGAVVVREGIIVGSGGTQVCGGDHAEVCAISAAGEACRGADLYVTLEPCCHHGKTPPCTDAIIRAGIRRVFVAIEDPNPLVAGKGVEALRAAGIDVEVCGDFAQGAYDLLRPFFSRMQNHRPHLLYKAAFSADGCTSTASGDSKWISSSESRYVVHRLRALADAVIVGKGTVNADNPSLSCRPGDFSRGTVSYFEKNPVNFTGSQNAFLSRLFAPSFSNSFRSPLRVCAGIPDLGASLHFFTDRNVLVFEKKSRIDSLLLSPDASKLRSLVSDGLIVEVPDGEDLAAFLMAELHRRGCSLLLLEGGPTLASSFERAGLIDEYLFFIAPKIVGGGNPVIKGEWRETIASSRSLRQVSFAACAGDLVYHGYSSEGGFSCSQG